MPAGLSEATVTEKQLDYIRSLLDQRDLLKSPKFFDAVNAMDVGELAAYIEHLKKMAAGLSKRSASKWISALVQLPNKEFSTDRKPVDVMRGRTRVEWEGIKGDDGKMRRIGKIILLDGRAVLEGSYGIDTKDDERFTNDISFSVSGLQKDTAKVGESRCTHLTTPTE